MAPTGSPDVPPYASFDEVREIYGCAFSDAGRRLCWPLEGDYPAAISVMKARGAINDLEPFFQPGPNGTGTWHEIASLPVTTRKVSSIVARLRGLGEWERNWVEWHEPHANAEFITYGDLSNDDRPYAKEQKEDGSWDEDSDTEFLIRCCGEERPLHKEGPYKKEITPSPGNEFVTVRDYVSAVHPWLMSLREDFLQYATVASPGYNVSSVAETEWMVSKGPDHEIWTESTWSERA